MRREWLGFVLAGLLVLPATAVGQSEEAQCRKRILVYIDISGSMRVPYQKTLTGLESLFREPGFIEATDVVDIVLFGEKASPNSVQGPLAAIALIGRLKGFKDWSRATDFRAVFTHLAETLPEGVFNRQVVVLASDFAHEPQDGNPSVEDWRLALEEGRTNLIDDFVGTKKTVMVLHRAEAISSSRREVGRQVVADLDSAFPVVAIVESASDPAELTRKLRKSLLDPLSLQVSRDPEDSSMLRFAVTNPNCYPLHLSHLSAKPKSGGEPFFFEIDAADRDLGTRGAQKILKFKVPEGEAWQAADVTATVETEEGAGGTNEGTTGNWLKYKAIAAVFERRWWPLRDVLRLDLELAGYTDPATTKPYTLTFGEDATPFAQARFEAPPFSGSEPQEYRLVLPLKKQGEEVGDIRVAIDKAEVLSTGGDRIVLIEDTLASHRNRVLAAVAGLVAIALIVGFFWVRTTVSSYPIFELSRRDYTIWVVMWLGGFLLILGNGLRIWMLRRESPEDLDQWVGGFSVFAVLGLFAFLVLRIVRAWFARSTVSSTPLSLRSYLLRSRLGNSAAWVIGVVLAGVLVFLWWQYSPAETRESRRSIELSSPHVTSD